MFTIPIEGNQNVEIQIKCEKEKQEKRKKKERNFMKVFSCTANKIICIHKRRKEDKKNLF